MSELRDKNKLIVLAGPTAVGKTALSILLAKRIGGEIISADSMQVYRHMDIGSAKITASEMEGVPHHLIDILEPTEEFNVFLFQSLARQAIKEIRELKEDFYKNVNVPGSQFEFNQELEKALRLEDFFEIGELMARDALNRQESCGGHFRVESQTEEGEAKRDDANFMYVAAWEYKGEGVEPELHKEPLKYEFIEVKTRNYKD